jgi:hypothetical protein
MQSRKDVADLAEATASASAPARQLRRKGQQRRREILDAAKAVLIERLWRMLTSLADHNVEMAGILKHANDEYRKVLVAELKEVAPHLSLARRLSSRRSWTA